MKWCLELFIFMALAAALHPSFISAGPLHMDTASAAGDRAFSEFNHHVAGASVLAVGALAFLGNASRRLDRLKMVWPLPFIMAGLYLALMSDPEVWPMGDEGWLHAFMTNPEAAEHKVYSILLILLGALEVQRGRGRLGKGLSFWGFPALAVFGAVLLLFHKHGAGMAMDDMQGMDHGAHAMDASMLKIQKEHLAFSITGTASAVLKTLHDGGLWRGRAASLAWPASLFLLGLLLVAYSE